MDKTENGHYIDAIEWDSLVKEHDALREAGEAMARAIEMSGCICVDDDECPGTCHAAHVAVSEWRKVAGR